MKEENRNHIEEVKGTFNRHSDRYENWYSKTEGNLIKETEKRAAERLIGGGRGLEVGVGSGIFASTLGVDYGIDPSGELLRLARDRGVKTVKGIAEMLPFKEASFDFLIIMFTLPFLANPSNAFREGHRVLEPDGKLIICFIQKESPWGKFYRKKKAEGHDFYKHARFYSTAEVERLLEESKFRKTEAISTLFQKPGSVQKIEDPTEGIRKSAGLCCLKAERE